MRMCSKNGHILFFYQIRKKNILRIGFLTKKT